MGNAGFLAVTDMLEHNKTLSALDISNNYINFEEASQIAGPLRTTTTLKSLNLRKCSVPFAALRDIVAALKDNPQAPVVDLGNLSPFGYTLSDVAELVVKEKVDKLHFFWTGEIVWSIPDWCNKVEDIVVTVESEDDDTLEDVCAYLEQGSARVKSLSIVCEDKSCETCFEVRDLLLRNYLVEELRINLRPVPADALKALTEGIGTNAHLRSLHVCIRNRWGAQYRAYVEEAVWFTKALERNRTLEVFECDFAFDDDAVRYISEHLYTNYALVKFQFRKKHRYEKPCWHVIGKRNAALHQQATHFVLEESTKKRWAAAFSLTHNTGTLRRTLEKATGKSVEEVERLIRAKVFHLRVNFFKITEVVKERVVCNAAPLGVVQIDRLDLPLLAHIASFLHVGDVQWPLCDRMRVMTLSAERLHAVLQGAEAFM
ncbi:uncharacterized protein LOC135366595 isoform X2 [Ornithodoros turicata]